MNHQTGSEGWLRENSIHHFSHRAMATVFEMFIQHVEHDYARQAAQEAFEEIDRLELELSRFIMNSDISRISTLRNGASTIIGLDAFTCLKMCQMLWRETNHAFDITIGEVLTLWKNREQVRPDAESIKAALLHSGFDRIVLGTSEYSVTVHDENPVCLDLGGFGKGYAVDVAAAFLREWQIEKALIHGGQSSSLAMAAPDGREGWPVTISHPASNEILYALDLQFSAISSSGLRKGEHIVDPRTGYPENTHLASWVVTPSAAEGDALSTAFLLLSRSEIQAYCEKFSDVCCLLLQKGGQDEWTAFNWNNKTESSENGCHS